MNTKTQHTPGPWQAYKGSGSMPHLYVTAGDNGPLSTITVVTRIRADDIDDPVASANAHIIAAAPELLAALRAFCDALEEESPSIATLDGIRYTARAAIRKAEGGTQ